jgi:hypothetical protein
MYIQKMRQNRHQVTDADGRTRTANELVPDADTLLLTDGEGTQYATQGNGVFHVPDAVGAEIVGGLWKDVSGVRGAPLRAPRPLEALQLPLEAVEAPSATPNAAAPVPEAETATEPAKKATRARKATKKAT